MEEKRIGDIWAWIYMAKELWVSVDISTIEFRKNEKCCMDAEIG